MVLENAGCCGRTDEVTCHPAGFPALGEAAVAFAEHMKGLSVPTGIILFQSNCHSAGAVLESKQLSVQCTSHAFRHCQA